MDLAEKQTILRKALDNEDIDLNKLGWKEARNDDDIFSYIRGYIWRSYGIRIKPPLDLIICLMVNDAMSKNQEIDEGQRVRRKDEVTNKKEIF